MVEADNIYWIMVSGLQHAATIQPKGMPQAVPRIFASCPEEISQWGILISYLRFTWQAAPVCVLLPGCTVLTLSKQWIDNQAINDRYLSAALRHSILGLFPLVSCIWKYLMDHIPCRYLFSTFLNVFNKQLIGKKKGIFGKEGFPGGKGLKCCYSHVQRWICNLGYLVPGLLHLHKHVILLLPTYTELCLKKLLIRKVDLISKKEIS